MINDRHSSIDLSVIVLSVSVLSTHISTGYRCLRFNSSLPRRTQSSHPPYLTFDSSPAAASTSPAMKWAKKMMDDTNREMESEHMNPPDADWKIAHIIELTPQKQR